MFMSMPRLQTTLPPAPTKEQKEQAAQDPLTKLRADVDVVTINITVLRDLLTDLKPGEELPEELQLVEDLHFSLTNMQQRIVDLINSEFSDDVTCTFDLNVSHLSFFLCLVELLTVNQEINNVFDKYNRYKTAKSGQPPAQTPETEENKQLREQLESFGVYEGVGTSKDTDPNRAQKEKEQKDKEKEEKDKKSASPSSTTEPEQQLDGLRTVALEKPMLTDDQAQDIAEWLGQEPAPTAKPDVKEPEKKPLPEDDGL